MVRAHERAGDVPRVRSGPDERIRIGHGVVCLPFRMNHPVKVAERVAMLDILSKGRVDFGIGKGGTLQEAGAFQTRSRRSGAARGAGRMIPRMWPRRSSSIRAS